MYDSYGFFVFTADNTSENNIGIYVTPSGIIVAKIIVINHNIPMSSLSGNSLSITCTSGTTKLNNGLIASRGTTYLADTSLSGSFSQTGSNTFSTQQGQFI